MNTTGKRIERAIGAAGLSQRAAAEAAGISQPTLSRIISGERVAKLPELVVIAAATGHTVAEFTEDSSVAARAQAAARATGTADMAEMRAEMLHYMELDAYLDDQAVPATP